MPINNNKKNISHIEGNTTNEIQRSMNIICDFYDHGKIYEALFSLDSVKALLNSSFKFDLLIAEHFNNELFLGFVFKFDIHFNFYTFE